MYRSRREFLKSSLAGGALLGLGSMAPQSVLRAFAEVDGAAATAQIRQLMLQGTAMAGEKAEKPLKILVLGGTAFLGPAFVELARARGHEITLFNRGRTNAHLFPELEKLEGDRKEGHAVLADREWDVVLDTSGYVPRVVKDAAETLQDNVGYYLFVSSISVYAAHDTPNMDETAAVGTLEDPTVEEITGETYGPLKAYCEQAAMETMKDRCCVVRPGLIVGPMDRTDRFTYWPVRVSRGGEVLAPGTPDQGIQVIDVRDLASFMMKCAEQRTTGLYNTVSMPNHITMGSLLDTCKKVSGSDATFTWADAAFLEEMEVAAWSEMPCWVPSDGEYAGFGLVNVDAARAKGMEIRDMASTVADTLQWWKTQPESAEGPRTELRAGIAHEKELQVLAAWHQRQAG